MPRTSIDQPTNYGHARRSTGSLRRGRFRQIAPEKREIVRGPWGGYTPDIEGPLASMKEAQLCNAFVVDSSGTRMKVDDGFIRAENAGAPTLPLGDTTPPAATGLPVIGLYEAIDKAANAIQLAVTGDTTGGASTGFVYTITGLNWTYVPFYTGAAATGMTNSELGDNVVFSFNPHAAQINCNHGGTGQTGANGVIVFANPADSVMVYPVSGGGGAPHYASGGTNYYEPLLNFATGGPAAMRARSVSTWADRTILLNTSEGGSPSDFPSRLRWTAAGSLDYNPAVLGAGAVDIDLLQGIGLRTLPLGDNLACYFDDGVVLVSRTGLYTRPFNLTLLTARRGLVGTHAITNLGGGIHFGVFEDGWFFLDHTGRWREAGVLELGRKSLRKWADTFYTLLNPNFRDRTFVWYDHIRRLIRIAFVSGDVGNNPCNNLWNYHIDTDSVWPDNQYDDRMPQVFGETSVGSDVAEQWDTYSGSTWDADPSRWSDLTADTGLNRVVHGTEDGLVMLRTPSTKLRDGSSPTLTYESHESDLGDPSDKKRITKVYIEFIDSGISTDTISIGISSGSEFLQSAVVNMGQYNAQTRAKEFVDFNQVVERARIVLSAHYATQITALELHFVTEGDEHDRLS